MFLLGRKREANALYPSFFTRIIASVIDIAIATIVIIPICNVIYGFVYDGLPPSKELGQIMAKSYAGAKTFEEAQTNLENDEEYQVFMHLHGYFDIFIEQSIQVIILGILILGFWLNTQSTPGKMLFSIKIVSNTNLKKPSLIQYIIRLCSYPISILPFGLGLFYILLNSKNRALHDVIAGTLVVSEKHLK
ncbi:MAG: RDD family protein [Alphaproteobacteria bacterium]|nr:RDD family protein [Alphaproteobacteria bacterium]